MFPKFAAILVLTLVTSGLIFSLGRSIFSNKRSSEDNNYTYLTGNITKIIKAEGIVSAIARVKHGFDSGTLDINQCHSLFHTIGHSVYEFHSKNQGVILSPESTMCSYGIEHGIEAQIVLAKYYDLTTMFNELHLYCKLFRQKFGDVECYHGAGHAFIQQGLSISNALKNCGRVVESGDNPEDCYRGAFSEYVNQLKGIDGDTDTHIPGVVPVNIEKKNTFDACLSLEKKYQNDCVSQFASFIYDGNLDSSLAACQTFTGWISRRCAQTMTGNFAFTNLPELKTISLPADYKKYSTQIRLGFIDGVIEGYVPYKSRDFFEGLDTWCNIIPIFSDRKYCHESL